MPAAAQAQEPAPVTIILDGRVLDLDPPAVIVDDRTLVPVAQVAAALQVQVTWDAARRAAVLVKGKDTVQIVADSANVTVNGMVINFGTEARIIQDRIYAPVWIMERFHAWVELNEADRSVHLTSEQPTAVVKRVYAPAFPLRVAWIADGRLCLLDGTVGGSQAVKVALNDQVSHIVGWSPDGWWLMFLCYPTQDSFSDLNYLWVVGAAGTGAFQVDPRPVESVESTPAWSPQADTIAYSTIAPDSTYHPDNNLKIARIADGKVEVATLLQEQGNAFGIFDFAWAPDGQSLAVSYPRSFDPPYQRLHVDRVTLKGDRATLFSAGEAGKPDFDNVIYPWAAWGLRWSPDGCYLAYHLRPISGSTSTDSVELQVIDLQHPEQPVDLGSGLHYVNWFAWSPDSSQLAYILGEGRFFNSNKHLSILNMKDGKATDCGQQGEVDIDPQWTGQPPYSLLFSRGPENPDWDTSGHNPGVPVPGQRVWVQAGDQPARLVTSGPDNAADQIVGVSPDGKFLVYLRQTVLFDGSLYLQPLAGGEGTELLRGTMLGQGFCGYFYPNWVSSIAMPGAMGANPLSTVFLDP
jgi:Tol biopolymer transport system component